MELTFEGVLFSSNEEKPVDLSIKMGDGHGSRAWYVDFMKISVVRANGFLGSVAEGGAVNFRDVFFNPHGNGTHTECLGHISPEAHSVNKIQFPVLLPCLVVSVFPESRQDDQVITAQELEQSISEHWDEGMNLPPALVVRTLPNSNSKVGCNWSNTNPPYFEPDGMTWLVGRGVEHLLVDLPSVDREVDGGALAAHHAFWAYPNNPRHQATITELIFVPDSLRDGKHLLNLQTAAFDMDATPSRPVIIPCDQN
ncbi:MAG: cyclase family protein [Bacteroidetes bacterium]|nr:cyclase family protein [Bacteroidota bacterium]